MDPPVADQIEAPWEKEEIPGEAFLFMRVHKSQIKNGEPIPGAFKNRPQSTDGMSTDWDKYSTADDCRQRARTPADNAVLQLKVEDVRNIPLQTVEHTPIYRPTEIPHVINRAHTDVFGEKDTEARLLFLRIYRMAISLDEG
jgi:hypothetical protein